MGAHHRFEVAGGATLRGPEKTSAMRLM